MGDSDSYNSWYDWYIAGGGRFNSDYPANQYNEGATNDILCASDPEEAKRMLEILDSVLERRRNIVSEYKNNYSDKGINIENILDNYGGIDDLDRDSRHALWSVAKAIDIVLEDWNEDSGYYDITNLTPDTAPLRLSLEGNDPYDDANDIWYLVPVDFHF